MAETQRNANRTYLILFGVLVLFVLGAYGLGRWQGRQEVQRVQERVAGLRESVAGDTAQAQGEINRLRSRVHMLEARRHLHLALLELDQRNFGMARERLTMAGREISAVQDPPPGSDAAALSRLAQELQSARLVAAEDFSEQRERILGWVRELDQQLPTEATMTSPAGAESPGEGAAAPGSAPGSAPAETAPPPAFP